MLIGYRNERLKRVCNSEEHARKHLPDEVHVRTLFRRLKEISAFDSFYEIPSDKPFRRHKLKGKRKGEWGITIRGGWRICIVPAGEYEM
ncbi:MAG TPA: hypothetical protein ENH10_00500, partial [Bacteroidetes bacterium]|nr:hypothetical protein [Bacteroidota bacterium]HEX03624.1 hypothetical protein [Bacteroidota bacterium]